MISKRRFNSHYSNQLIDEGALQVNLQEWNEAWSKMVIESEPLTTSWMFLKRGLVFQICMNLIQIGKD